MKNIKLRIIKFLVTPNKNHLNLQLGSFSHIYLKSAYNHIFSPNKQVKIH